MKIQRSTIYYKRKISETEKVSSHEEELLLVKNVFEENHKRFGARNIKKKLAEKEIVMSRRKISRLMQELGLVSSYGIPTYIKPSSKKKIKSNHAETSNLVGRNFDGWNKKEVIVSDLTYVKVVGKRCHICVLIDLFNREIIGWSIGENKTADLVLLAFAMAKIDWRRVLIFHTERGMEFCAKSIDTFLLKKESLEV